MIKNDYSLAMIKFLSVITLAFVFCEISASANNAWQNHFPWSREIKLNGAMPGGAAYFEFDSEFYQRTDDLLGDWRAMDLNGNEVYFTVGRPSRNEILVFDEACESRITSLKLLPDGVTELQLKLVDGDIENWEFNAIELFTPEKNFEFLVSIYDAQSNTPLAIDRPFTDRSRQHEDASEMFRFSRLVNDRTYRIELRTADYSPKQQIENNSEPIRIDNAIIYRRRLERRGGQPILRYYEVEANTPLINSESIIYRFETNREPLRELEIQSSSPRFLRPFELSGSNDGQQWRPIASGSFRRLNDNSPVLRASFGEERYRYYRLEIQDPNSDGALEDLQIRWRGTSYLAYFPEAPSQMTIYFGANAPRPRNNMTLDDKSASQLGKIFYSSYMPQLNTDWERPDQKLIIGRIIMALCLGSAVLILIVVFSLRRLHKPTN